MPLYLWVAVGSALGGVARYALAGWVAQRWGEAFPWGTLLVNVLGCCAIGFFATLTAAEGRHPVGAAGRLFFMTGVLGGFTTFSAFSLQTLLLVRAGEWVRAGGYAFGSFGLCLAAVALGHAGAAALQAARGP